jgi:hypothetical protein
MASEGQQVLDALAGISYQEVVAALEADGVERFIASWDELVHMVSRRSPLPAEHRS